MLRPIWNMYITSSKVQSEAEFTVRLLLENSVYWTWPMRCSHELTACGGLNVTGSHREWHYREVWLCWSRCGLIGGSVPLWGWALRSHICSSHA